MDESNDRTPETDDALVDGTNDDAASDAVGFSRGRRRCDAGPFSHGGAS